MRRIGQRQHRLLNITVALAAMEWSAAMATGGETPDANSAKDADAVVITDLDAIASRLKEIRDAAREYEKRFDNLRIKGRIEPLGEILTLTSRHGKFRVDRHWVRRDGVRMTGHVLDDGKTCLMFYNGILKLNPSCQHWDQFIRETTSVISDCLFPEWQYYQVPVSQLCHGLIVLIHREGVFGEMSLIKLVLRETGDNLTEIVVTNEKRVPSVPLRSSVTIDRSKNCAMTGYSQWYSAKIGPTVTDWEKHVRCEYREVEPGVFFISKGTWLHKESDRQTEKSGDVDRGAVTLVIDSVEFNDFEVDESYFDVHRWPPIKPGINILDNRKEPAKKFRYEGGSIEKGVLGLDSQQ